ncbi:MAG: electron transfer flavoprotein-ubiquinone oxidoreductase [Planctomycetota bacterium]|nr:electron transfer flavoprotein-ubiquinone oxidoreductase [Planctomycetota bacterium]
MSERDVLELDCVVVGGGPAGLAAALRFQQRAEQEGRSDLAIAVLEKASSAGLHLLSGAVVDPRGLDELLPGWRELDPPIEAEVHSERFYAFSSRRAYRLPTPPPMHNKGNFVCSLNRLAGWLAGIAEGRGIDIFCEFPARELIVEDGRVCGVVLGDQGIAKDGSRRPNYMPGAEVRAKVTILCDGVRGNLTKQLMSRFPAILRDRNAQDYETGVKELWQVRPGSFPAGRVVHTLGWPLPPDIYGGSWIYGMSGDRISLGLVMGLDYTDPTYDLHREFSRFKTHPYIREILKDGKLIRYGAKAIPGGGLYAMPRIYGTGWLLAGDAAGMVNMARLKGIHLALKSGALAGDAAFDAVASGDVSAERLSSYERAFGESWAFDELHGVRNFRAAFKKWRRPRAMLAVVLQTLLNGRGVTYARLRHTQPVHAGLGAPRPPAEGPAFDGELTFEKLTDVYYSGTSHEEDQPSHLVVVDPSVCVERCTAEYGNPCQYFCPAGVYEFETELVINAANCVHCKTCDIKDPYGIIDWVTPEGGGGPNYTDL